jgi:hypothetical protein
MEPGYYKISGYGYTGKVNIGNSELQFINGIYVGSSGNIELIMPL